MQLDEPEALRRATGADHGILATLHPSRGADVVPVCFAIVGGWVAIPVDTIKPKASSTLGRIRNLERDPRATLLVEQWDAADWSRLWWVRLALRRVAAPGDARARLERALRTRYAQYARAAFEEVLTFEIQGVAGWSAS